MQDQIHISVVSPVYRAANEVEQLVSQLQTHLTKITNDFEIILVEDCGGDGSWDAIQRCCALDSRVIGIKLSRNFGQHYAITAGMEAASGEWLIIMDCDLQDRPDQISKLYEKAQEGYDLVLARRVVRKDKMLKRWSSKVFYRLFAYLTDTEQDEAVANFGIYSRKVSAAILSMGDQVRYFPAMSQWVGFKRTSIHVEHSARASGESSYSWSRLFSLAWENIIAFSHKPLTLTMQFGFLLSVLSGLVGIFFLFRYLLGGISVSGFTSIIISIWFLGSIIIFLIGVIGVYLGKIFDNVKSRPTYIIDKAINLK